MNNVAPIPSHGLFQNLTGKRFGRLLVKSYAGRISSNNQWNCVCDCGTECRTAGGNLKTGHTASCGCLHREKSSSSARTHGESQSAEYKTWSRMKKRCQNKKDTSYPNYGGRGIKVCERWDRSFKSFLNDMGPRPTNQHSIERINVNGGYEPKNCKWATPDEQANNKRSSHWLTIEGETKTLQQWADDAGLDRYAVVARVQSGVTGKDLLAPSKKFNTLTYKGITDSYKGWSARTGINPETISQRIRRDRWSVEKTLTVGAKRCV